MAEAESLPRFVVRKVNKRLGIYDRTTGALVYSPPTFLVLRSRAGLIILAERFEAAGGRDIAAIMRFERKRNPRVAEQIRNEAEG